MPETVAAQLRRTLVDIDQQLLRILTSRASLDHGRIERVASLEHARSATQRLLLLAEADELKSSSERGEH
jgi:hypothetical protein